MALYYFRLCYNQSNYSFYGGFMLKNNPHILAASKTGFRPHPAVALMLFLAMLFFSELLALPFKMVFDFISKPWAGQLPITIKYTISELILPFLALTVIVFLWVRFFEKRDIASLGFPRSFWSFSYLKGFGLGVVLMSLYVGVALAFGVYSLDHFSINATSYGLLLSLLVTLPGWVIQSSSEEILTRGWLLQTASQNRIATGIFISSTVFALLHFANNGLTVLAIVNLILYGLFAAFYTLKNENLWAVCGFHASWNFSQGNIYGISVSGHPILGGSLVNPGSAVGPDYLTGGAFGAEGSVIVSMILLLGIAYMLILDRYRKKAPL